MQDALVPPTVRTQTFLRTQYRNITLASLLVIDLFSIVAGLYLAYRLRLWLPLPDRWEGDVPRFMTFWPLLLAQTVSIIGAFFLARMYHRNRARYTSDELQAIVSGVSIGTLISIAISAFSTKSTPDYPRVMIIYAWVVTIALVLILRTAQARVQRSLQVRGIGRTRLLVVGAGDPALQVVQRIQAQPRLGYDIVGVACREERAPAGLPRLGGLSDLTNLVERESIDEVIVAMPGSSDQEMIDIIGQCDRSTISIKVVPDLFQIMAGQMSIGELSGLPLLSVRDVSLRGWRLAVKRVMDVVISAVTLVLGSPLLVFLALLIKRDSPGPVFFIQERMGLDGKPFPCIKFRTMRQDAERLGTWTVKDDPRKTKLGSRLRRTNLDELPQFINVLLGHMSVVGPRPEQPQYVQQFRQRIPRYMERHREKAGITGWAQVNGLRGDTSIEERTSYDLWYVENWSVWLDIKIISRQLWQWVAGRDENAY